MLIRVAARAWPLMAVAGVVAAAEADAEIDALLARLARSPCAFERNGQWHGGRDASAHLATKRRMAPADASSATEAFIDGIASRSSQSGQPYRVRCPGTPDQPAADWLLRQLDDLRSGR